MTVGLAHRSPLAGAALPDGLREIPFLTQIDAATNNTVTSAPLGTSAMKGGTPTGTTSTTSAATNAVTRVQAPTAGVTARPDASMATAATRLPSTTQRTTSVPESAFSR